MEEKVEIKKIVLDLGDKDIELTVKQAKKLNDILGEMFDYKTRVNYPTYPIVIQSPYYPPYYTGIPVFEWAQENPSWISDGTGVPMSMENGTLSLCLDNLE